MSITDHRRSFRKLLTTRERRKLRLRARRTTRLVVIVAGAIAASIAAVLFAKLCDLAQAGHSHILGASKLLALVILPLSFAASVWLTRRFARL